ncbi:GH10905 [Drosophila grimshawi]|uniref:GH10905 n=1 Tax=Drosophila grimshawi TaxID=7222 RepID=B4K2X8_DROGR|nr:GH10905 [Drosophila grimshawi]
MKAGQYDPKNPELPLDNCDIYGSAEAGAAFHNMLSLGASKPWPDALQAFNGERVMTGKAIAEYFEPLRVWLEAENIKNNVHIGWTASDSKCTKSMDISNQSQLYHNYLTECVSY